MLCPLQKVVLSPTSEEYHKVWVHFNNTLPYYSVQKIERVQNLALWEVYQWYVGAALGMLTVPSHVLADCFPEGHPREQACGQDPCPHLPPLHLSSEC